VARNRKRAKERRVRQAEPVVSAHERERRVLDGDGDGAPDPIEHAAPDAELAEAQLATASWLESGPVAPSEEELGENGQVAEDVAEPSASLDDPGPPGPPAPPGLTESSGAAAPAPAPLPAHRQWLGARLIGFLEGSWRELQRVQWPDRRQVMQATGVVVGFVIVASVFLGVADLVASKVVHFILNGTF
jgi:preprotein translocase subunit SecE